jgi:TorA maturation chaperone TorD
MMTTDLQQAPKLLPFNSTLSMKAMCAQQAIEALRQELEKLTPAECIAIEMEMATQIHQRPALAHAKFAKTVAAIAAIMPWFETFLELLRTGERGEAA